MAKARLNRGRDGPEGRRPAFFLPGVALDFAGIHWK